MILLGNVLGVAAAIAVVLVLGGFKLLRNLLTIGLVVLLIFFLL